jgi:hypothetical protein
VRLLGRLRLRLLPVVGRLRALLSSTTSVLIHRYSRWPGLTIVNPANAV